MVRHRLSPHRKAHTRLEHADPMPEKAVGKERERAEKVERKFLADEHNARNDIFRKNLRDATRVISCFGGVVLAQDRIAHRAHRGMRDAGVTITPASSYSINGVDQPVKVGTIASGSTGTEASGVTAADTSENSAKTYSGNVNIRNS